ncbi:MAG: endonuclease/exonuclease/phosphatase family protein [Bacteroidales bacterium]|nr:endonuclease/exonuclease/phosphatase family protein [Bacteroidales bacterium]
MRKFIYKIGVILNYIFAVLLLLSYLSVHIRPGSIPFLALLGLLFPFLLLINFVFMIIRIWQKKKLFLLSLFVILLGFFRITDFYAFNNKEVVTIPVNPLKVMSYNVRLFDLYKWSGEDKGGEKIFEIIKDENADVICLQEFFSNTKHNYQDKIIEFQKTKDYLISSKDKSGYSGNAIFSRYPIVSSGYINIGSIKQKCIYADILKGKDTIRVYSIHLASIRLSGDDYEFLKSLKNNDQHDNIEGVKGIGSKMIQAYKIRAHEVDAVAPHIKNSPYKTIVCGDFNDTPISYSYKKIKGELKDVFIESGFGIGNTYAKSLPLFRIDYILHSKEMKTISYKRIKQEYSDHYAISALIDF